MSVVVAFVVVVVVVVVVVFVVAVIVVAVVVVAVVIVVVIVVAVVEVVVVVVVIVVVVVSRCVHVELLVCTHTSVIENQLLADAHVVVLPHAHKYVGVCKHVRNQSLVDALAGPGVACTGGGHHGKVPL